MTGEAITSCCNRTSVSLAIDQCYWPGQIVTKAPHWVQCTNPHPTPLHLAHVWQLVWQLTSVHNALACEVSQPPIMSTTSYKGNFKTKQSKLCHLLSVVMYVRTYVSMYVYNYACKDQKHDQSDAIIQSTALTIGVKWNGSEPQLRRTCVVVLAKGEREPEDPPLPRCATQASDSSLPLKQVFLIQRLCSYALHVCT